MRAKPFQEGLRTNIGAQVAPFMLHTYSEVVTKALIMEREIEEVQRVRDRNFRSVGVKKEARGVKHPKMSVPQ